MTGATYAKLCLSLASVRQSSNTTEKMVQHLFIFHDHFSQKMLTHGLESVKKAKH